MIIATPAKAPSPETFLNPSAFDQSQIALAASCTATGLPCRIPVHVGLFFDGTNNNMARDRDGKRIGFPDPNSSLPNKPLKPEQCSHSNVARLFRAFPENKQANGYFSYYIQGVGTPFKEIGEPTESPEGKAFAKGGQLRIAWGLLQVLNALHSTIDEKKRSLYEDVVAGQLAQSYDKEVDRTEQRGNGKGPTTVKTHRKWFAPHIDKLKAALAIRPKPSIPSLTLSVFGFSRGAAQAAAFCHLFDDLLEDGKFAGIATRICFLGVFDTVATVGGSASMAVTQPLPGAIFDGHWAWAKHILKPLPSCVEAGLHCVATHEQRMNFPVTLWQGNDEKFKQVYFPGVHSDVGGGYGPGEQGKARAGQSDLLSQIPLLHMFKAARLGGVPLTPYSELEATIRDDFQVSNELASAWDAYTAALGKKDAALLTKHMQLYYRWRAARLQSLETTASFKAASAQDQQDLRDANRMLAGDLEALKFRRKPPPASARAEGDNKPYSQSDLTRINQWHLKRAQKRTELDDWEKDALAIFDAPEPLPAEVMRFFDDYVHDSFAGFYMAGEVTEYDKRVKVASVMKEKPENLKGFDKRVFDVSRNTQAAQEKKKTSKVLSPQEEALVSEAEHGTPFPIMNDTDSTDMRSPVITTQTATRREGGGYILRRGYYPHSGFFIRESIHEKELRQVPTTYNLRKDNAKDEVLVEFVWSDNLRQDIELAMQEDQINLADQEDVAMIA